ncbi:phospholipase, partial [Streptomyces sp. SID11233]|nr:phospholipase [Streptomyces sp. SID11233]
MRKLRKVVPAARRHEVVEGEAAPADVLSYLLHLPEEYDADP